MKQIKESPVVLAEVDIFDLMADQSVVHEGAKMVSIVRNFVKDIKLLDANGSSKKAHELNLESAMDKLKPFLARKEDEALLLNILVKLMSQV